MSLQEYVTQLKLINESISKFYTSLNVDAFRNVAIIETLIKFDLFIIQIKDVVCNVKTLPGWSKIEYGRHGTCENILDVINDINMFLGGTGMIFDSFHVKMKDICDLKIRDNSNVCDDEIALMLQCVKQQTTTSLVFLVRNLQMKLHQCVDTLEQNAEFFAISQNTMYT